MPVHEDLDLSESHAELDNGGEEPEEQLSVHGRFMVSSKRLPRADEVLEQEQRQYRLTALPVSDSFLPLFSPDGKLIDLFLFNFQIARGSSQIMVCQSARMGWKSFVNLRTDGRERL